jgi:hypothetical protein
VDAYRARTIRRPNAPHGRAAGADRDIATLAQYRAPSRRDEIAARGRRAAKILTRFDRIARRTGQSSHHDGGHPYGTESTKGMHAETLACHEY